MKNIRFIFALFILKLFLLDDVKAQDYKLDTLNLALFQNNCISIQMNKKELFKEFGKPTIYNKRTIKSIYYTSCDSLAKRKDTIITYYSIVFDKVGLVYESIENSAKLSGIDFRVSDKSLCYLNKTFDKNYSMEQLKNDFPLSYSLREKIDINMCPFIQLSETKDDFYLVTFNNGVNCDKWIKLYFYNNSLIHIRIDL